MSASVCGAESASERPRIRRSNSIPAKHRVSPAVVYNPKIMPPILVPPMTKDEPVYSVKTTQVPPTRRFSAGPMAFEFPGPAFADAPLKALDALLRSREQFEPESKFSTVSDPSMEITKSPNGEERGGLSSPSHAVPKAEMKASENDPSLRSQRFSADLVLENQFVVCKDASLSSDCNTAERTRDSISICASAVSHSSRALRVFTQHDAEHIYPWIQSIGIGQRNVSISSGNLTIHQSAHTIPSQPSPETDRYRKFGGSSSEKSIVPSLKNIRISKTIDELELLMEEALRIAETQGEQKLNLKTSVPRKDSSNSNSIDLALVPPRHLNNLHRSRPHIPPTGISQPQSARELHRYLTYKPATCEHLGVSAAKDWANCPDSLEEREPNEYRARPNLQRIDTRERKFIVSRGLRDQQRAPMNSWQKPALSNVPLRSTNKCNAPANDASHKQSGSTSFRTQDALGLSRSVNDFHDLPHGLGANAGPGEHPGSEPGSASPQELCIGEGVEQGKVNEKSQNHLSIKSVAGFSLSRSHRHSSIARDWSAGKKRFVATTTCITTALIGLIIGIYAGEVPAIQYTLADQHHRIILGNVLLFLGLALTTFLTWPLPLLHGRKPYTLFALAIALPLQFPQALAVNNFRPSNSSVFEVELLLPRMLCGLALGFANINFKTTLLDLFGASLQSDNPHQEVVNENDVRRHGGGMGMWLGIWTWCSVMSIAVGFFIGASIISRLSVASGFWITIGLNALVLLLNVVTPEVRRSPYRRSMAEVRTQTSAGIEVSRRIARGEIKMHLDSTGPKSWYEEVLAGYRLSLYMLKQPGFLILALYQGWIYGQIVMVVVLLGALLSKYYLFRPEFVGLGVSAVAFAALLAIPFQKASLLSRARTRKPRTDSMTFEKRVTFTSHLVRRTIFMILLPFAGLAYTLSSGGTHTPFILPTLFAGLIGFLSNLAIAECNGLIMETFDTSDLQPGMTGRPRRELPESVRKKRTNFSCFPRVSAGFAITQTFAFLIAAAATGCGGVIERHIGAQEATAVVAGILLILSLLLIGVLWRSRTVQIIPQGKFGTAILSGPEDEWKPVIIGNPSGTTRRMNWLELGKMSRWTEIRRRNRLGTMYPN